MIDNQCRFSKKAASILLAATSFLVMSCSDNVKELSPLNMDKLGITIPDGQSREYSYTHFAKPSYRENLKSMSRYFDPPLTYQSVE